MTLALIWLYNGLYLKVMTVDPHHLEIVRNVFSAHGGNATSILKAIGCGETVLALAILSGLFYRFVAYFQIVIILAMNLIGSISGGGSIAHPIGLLITNLPTLMCALIVAWRGPGSFSLSFNK